MNNEANSSVRDRQNEPESIGNRQAFEDQETDIGNHREPDRLPLLERIRNSLQTHNRRGLFDARIHHIQEMDVDESDEIMVLEDLDNGREYYLYAIDRFTVRGRPYAMLASFEPDEGKRRIPNLVMMRYQLSDNGQQYYTSIRNEEELDEAFDVFYDRLEKGLFP